MKLRNWVLVGLGAAAASSANAWEANVADILHHYNYVAVYLSPDPGPGSCQHGSPYLLVLDDTFASKQRFSMLMTALATGQKVGGYSDGCDTGIWGQSRPTIQRLLLRSNY